MTDTTNQSSYIRYLPPILWEGDNPLLKRLLPVFEKILSGIDDGVAIQHTDHKHEAIETLISQIYQLFDPWQTPPQFLDWLASWVDLELPQVWDTQKHQYIPRWSEYQRRNAIAQIVPIYQQRGLKMGLDRFLKLSIPAEIQPRITIDDGSCVLFMQPQPERFAQLTTLLGQKPFLSKDASSNDVVLFEGPIAPLGIALAPDNSLLLCDNGVPQALTPTRTFGVGKGIWRVQPFGQNNPSQTSGQPQRVGPPFVDQTHQPIWSLNMPMAIAVDNLSPWHVYVLSGGTILYQFTSSDFSTIKTSASQAIQGSNWTIKQPVAMLFDTTTGPTSGHLFVLDRGLAPASGGSSPKIIDINLQASPATLTTHPLTNVVEPLSLALLSNGDLIIGDGGQQNAAVPADLLRVVRSTTSPTWEAKSLLNAVSQNPFIAPVSLIRIDDTHIFVLDLGLKPYLPVAALDPNLTGKPFLRNLAAPAAIYQVDIGSTQPQVMQASEEGQFVYPTGMVQDQQGMLYIADRGEYSDPNQSGEMLRVWRAKAHEFGVAVYFSQQSSAQDRSQIMQTLSEIITREKPVHTDWATVYGVDEVVKQS